MVIIIFLEGWLRLVEEHVILYYVELPIGFVSKNPEWSPIRELAMSVGA